MKKIYLSQLHIYFIIFLGIKTSAAKAYLTICIIKNDKKDNYIKKKYLLDLAFKMTKMTEWWNKIDNFKIRQLI